jgi:hypothetical protein
MASLALPTRPANLRGRFGDLVESDVFHICERLHELDKSLNVHVIDPPIAFGEKVYRFAVTEQCADGVERLVFRVEELDARIIEHVRYLLRVPFEHRFNEAEKLADKLTAEAKEHELDKLYDTMGAPMLRQLEHDGFITHRGKSFPKRGVRPS